MDLGSAEVLEDTQATQMNEKTDFFDTNVLLESYNDLSSSFRNYVLSHSNEYSVQLAVELQSENTKLKKDKFLLTQQIVKVLEENRKLSLKDGTEIGKGTEAHEVEMSLWHIDKGNGNNEEIRSLRTELEALGKIVEKQDSVIKALENELKVSGEKIRLPGLEVELKNCYVMKANLEDLSGSCKKYREYCKDLKNQLKGFCDEVRILRKVAADLSSEKLLMGKIQESLIYENTSLTKILKDYENLSLTQIQNHYTSDLTNLIQTYSKEILNLNQANFKLSSENQDLETKLLSLATQSSKKTDEFSQNLQEKQQIFTSQQEKLKNLQKELNEEKSANLELKSNLETSQKECEELQKNCKRTKNELESVKTVLGKRIDQLDKTVLLKSQEIEKLHSTSQSTLEKLIVLLHQFTKQSGNLSST